jgi:hypothetical protein
MFDQKLEGQDQMQKAREIDVIICFIHADQAIGTTIYI